MAEYDNLSDEELRTKLQEAGINCGPILESTRKLYINKLKKLSGQPASHAPAALDEVDEEDDEPTTAQRSSPPRPKSAKASPSPAKRSPEQSGDSGEVTVRQRRPLHRKLGVKIEQEVEETGGGFLRYFSRFLILMVFCAVLYLVYSMYVNQMSRRQEISDGSV